MPQKHRIDIVELGDGCDAEDERTHSNRTHAKQQDTVQWHNKLDYDVVVTFTNGTPLDVDNVPVPLRSWSPEYPIRPDAGREEPYEYEPCDKTTAPPPAIIVPPPPPPGNG